ncbi:Imm17 family immunity protein [Saccharicrinis fermentans]|uniref:Immunity protein 17 n=1 Tax=Saccharicrinis fermentans DSM 9555 = JCM 21142 TaxID=869213 RepID=W7YB17_9BACT|nr:Imm17 family immunity protein [Saccharicrinis fermentans]GAF04848.1 hypothetical protein JCM21142_93568 [Saccharicrinis fermentans DSM 9555 = JCM 21142]
MREGSTLINVLFLVFGMVLFTAALFNWEYFFSLRKAKMLSKAIGLNGARVVYALLGLFFSLLGADMLMAWGLFNF